MRIIDITHPPQSLWIGREGENTFRPVSFECANWFSAYPNATIAAYYQPYGEADPYPLVLVEDGTKRIWHPLLNELVKGDGELQIVLMQGETVGTSAIIPTKVDRSLISNADHPASETPAWTVKVVQDVTEQADRAEEAVEHYPQIRNDYWWVWDAENGEWVNTGVKATGEGGGAVESVNGKTGVVVLDAEDVGALPDDTVIPSQIGQLSDNVGLVHYNSQTLTDAQKAQARTNVGAGTYSKPSGGIPASDLASAVQTSLGKADTALQSHQSLAAYRTASAQDAIDAAQDSAIAAKYTKPSGGIPKSDLASAVQTSLGKADTALQTAPVTSVNNKTGAVTLTASDVNALPDSTVIPTVPQMATEADMSDWTSGKTVDAATLKTNFSAALLELGDKANTSDIPTAVSDLTNDSGFQTLAQVQSAIAAIPDELPTVTASDNGKFLRVVNGAWAAETVSTWQGGSY